MKIKTLEQIDEEFIRACSDEFDLPISIADSKTLAERYKEHEGHKIEVGRYGQMQDETFETWNVAVECLDCYTVLLDSDITENSASREQFLEGENHL